MSIKKTTRSMINSARSHKHRWATLTDRKHTAAMIRAERKAGNAARVRKGYIGHD